MSRSVTVRPTAAASVNRGRGTSRGRGRGTTKTYTQNSGSKMSSPQGPAIGGDQEKPSQPDNPAPEERVERRDAYTVITPNEKKRQQISKQAQAGEAAYTKYKEEKKLNHVSYVGTVGGGEVSQPEARRAVQQQSQAALSPFAKAQKHREAKKREEDVNLHRMKAEQRIKANQNTERNSARQRRLDPHRVTANEAFLSRIEQQNKQKQRQKVLSTSAAKNTEDLPSSAETSSQYDGTACAPGSYSSNSASAVVQLQRRYPHCDKDVLNDLLLQMNGDIDSVCSMLG